jgi:inner membrane protein YidH
LAGPETSGTQGWSASRTRDHLANERTYLAWLRTAANVMVLGLAVARLIGHGGTRAVVAGAILVVVGAAGLVYGAIRYKRVSVEIEQNRLVQNIGVRGPMIAAAVLIAAIAATLALLTA